MTAPEGARCIDCDELLPADEQDFHFCVRCHLIVNGESCADCEADLEPQWSDCTECDAQTL
jgi:hypothetical protein